jgi:hypothetical protein
MSTMIRAWFCATGGRIRFGDVVIGTELPVNPVRSRIAGMPAIVSSWNLLKSAMFSLETRMVWWTRSMGHQPCAPLSVIESRRDGADSLYQMADA